MLESASKGRKKYWPCANMKSVDDTLTLRNQHNREHIYDTVVGTVY